jgi:hypothetical protein
VQGLDIIANTVSDGSGSDISSSIAVYGSLDGSSSSIRLVNNNASTAFLTTFRIRGTPITRYEKTAIEAQDADSFVTFGIRQKVYDLRLASDNDADTIAQHELNKYKDGASRFETVSFYANQSEETMTQALIRTIGDQITVSDSYSGHNKDYIIVGERHQLTGGASHANIRHVPLNTTWVLLPIVS